MFYSLGKLGFGWMRAKLTELFGPHAKHFMWQRTICTSLRTRHSHYVYISLLSFMLYTQYIFCDIVLYVLGKGIVLFLEITNMFLNYIKIINKLISTAEKNINNC